jgi:hypothetical protein
MRSSSVYIIHDYVLQGKGSRARPSFLSDMELQFWGVVCPTFGKIVPVSSSRFDRAVGGLETSSNNHNQ